MSATADLIEFYKQLLESLGCIVDKSGLVSRNINDSVKPYFVKIDTPNGEIEKRLCLPTDRFLADPDWDSMCPFHPLGESIVKGESVIIRELRKMISFRITELFSILSIDLMEIAADKTKQKKLSPTVAKEFLSKIPNATEKTLNNLSKIIRSLQMYGEKKLNTIYLKRGGSLRSLDGKSRTYSRVSRIAFPLLEEVNKDEKEIYEVKLSSAEKSDIKNLINFIIPDYDIDTKYCFGSDSDYAPNFHSLCGLFVNVISQFNAIVTMFGKTLDPDNELKIDISWKSQLNDEVFAAYHSKIPPLPYNDGEENKVSEKKTATFNQPASFNSTYQPPTQSMQPMMQQPQQQFINTPSVQMQTDVVTEDGKRSWNSIKNKNPALAGYPNIPNPAQMMHAQPPSFYNPGMANPMQPQQQFFNNGGYNNMMPQQPMMPPMMNNMPIGNMSYGAAGDI